MTEITRKTNLTKFLNTTDTEWKVLEDFPNYIITCHGNVWTLNQGRFIYQTMGNAGYFQVTLRANNKFYTRTVHGLVAKTFLGERPKGMTINHINGIKSDNALSNLEYITASDNTQAALEMGLIKTLDNSALATKKNDNVINAIYEYLTTNGSKTIIGKKYDISNQYINRVLDGKLRKDIWKESKLAQYKPF